MKIYTRTGDDGETSFFGGGRVPKSNRRVAAYGDLDELNAALGLAGSALAQDDPLLETVHTIQRVLFGIGGEVATLRPEAMKKLRGLVAASDVELLERSIDAMETELPGLSNFILPGGGRAGAAFHLARTICRRAERSVVALGADEPVRPEILHYVNRLSDWIFVASRFVNHREGCPEIPW